MPGPTSGRPLDVAACQRVFATFYRHIVIQPDGCWTWTGSRNANGYGRIRVGGADIHYAHRVSWVARNGRDIPSGMTIDHVCEIKSCVNPDHLIVATQSDNCARREATKRRLTAPQMVTVTA